MMHNVALLHVINRVIDACFCDGTRCQVYLSWPSAALVSVFPFVAGSFAILCPDGYGYVKKTITEDMTGRRAANTQP